MKDIFQKFSTKLQVDTDSLYFIYGGNVINKDLTLTQLIGLSPKDAITILVYQTNGPDDVINPNDSLTRPKFIMCKHVMKISDIILLITK